MQYVERKNVRGWERIESMGQTLKEIEQIGETERVNNFFFAKETRRKESEFISPFEQEE